MPAKHPRLTITMQPTLHAIFRRLSELTGQSQSQLVFELLDGVQSPLMKVIQLLETADEAKAQLSGTLALNLNDAQDRVERQLGLVLEDLGEPEYLLESVCSDRVPFRSRRAVGQGAKRTGRQGVESVPKPPASNRGVRSLTTRTKPSTKARS
jgi:hypothetical protein